MQVRITVPLHATEDERVVRRALLAFWPDAVVEAEEGRLVAHAASLDAFRDAVWSQRIIDTTRAQMMEGLDERGTRFVLSKQAAVAGKVSFPARAHALGELNVRADLEDDDPWTDAEALVWWVCPETADGEIVA